jgi:hypothetical protein
MAMAVNGYGRCLVISYWWSVASGWGGKGPWHVAPPKTGLHPRSRKARDLGHPQTRVSDPQCFAHPVHTERGQGRGSRAMLPQGCEAFSTLFAKSANKNGATSEVLRSFAWPHDHIRPAELRSAARARTLAPTLNPTPVSEDACAYMIISAGRRRRRSACRCRWRNPSRRR